MRRNEKKNAKKKEKKEKENEKNRTTSVSACGFNRERIKELLFNS